MKAPALLKHNIDALLNKRGQSRRDLAMWVRQSTDKDLVDAWISGIFTRPEREFQMKYLDRIADFFGVAVYQLFQPGISPLTERRSGRERRTGLDRRVSNRQAQLRPAYQPAMETVTPGERAHLERWRRLDGTARRQLDAMLDWALRQPPDAPNTSGPPVARQSLPEPAEPVPRSRKPKTPPP